MKQMDRRSFLSLAGAVAAGAVLGRSAYGEPMGLPAGIQLYAVRDPLEADTAGTLKALHDMGYREVETAGFAKHTAKEFHQLVADAGLKVPSAHVPFQEAKDVGAVLADANALGAQYATSSFLRDLAGASEGKALPPLGLDGFKRTAAQMNEYGRAAKAAGLQYAYHNHNYEFEKMPDGSYGYDILLRETDAGLVKFEADCGWMSVAGVQPQDYFKRYPGRFRMLHVKDFKAGAKTIDLIGPGRPQGVELGHGFIDYKPIFAAGKAAGIQHAFAEQEAPYEGGQLASAKASYGCFHSFV